MKYFSYVIVCFVYVDDVLNESKSRLETNILSIDFLYGYKCPFCGENFSKNLEDYVEGSSSDERYMGEQREYNILCEDACPKCNENFKIEGTLYGYPVGIKNLDEIKIYWENEKTEYDD